MNLVKNVLAPYTHAELSQNTAFQGLVPYRRDRMAQFVPYN